MRILITGGNGFIAKSISKHFYNHDITSINRNTFDLRNRTQFDVFMNGKTFDVVFHTAAVGVSRSDSISSDILFDNVAMFYNILRHRAKFGKIINFGSGAELDRYTVNREDDEQFPIDPYGMSKNLIHRVGLQFDNVCNLRIYNVFGYHELSSRMIKSNITNYINRQPIIIHQDKLMDFFYIKDLMTVIDKCLEFNINDVTCVYSEKYKLSDIARIINNINDYRVQVKIQEDGLAEPYIGSFTSLDKLNLHLYGLHAGIKEIYNKLVVNR
jgi:GDP-L-fucose synthase